MFQCNKTEKIACSIILLFLCCFLSFHISEYSNGIEITILGTDAPKFYLLFLDVSSITIAITPLLFFFFLFGTTSIMTNFFFDLECKKEHIIFASGLSLIPLLFSLFFSWYNLVNYVSYDAISSGKTVKDITYIFGLSYTDIENINLISRIMIYIFFIVSLLTQVKDHYYKLIISATLPTIMVIFSYAIICAI